MSSAFCKIYPESNVAGFSRDDVTVCFYNFVNGVTGPESVVVDLGAGRGGQIENAKHHYIRSLITLQGKGKRLIGLDTNDAVLSNPYLDEKHVFDPSEPLPLEDGSIDVIYADWVLEHIEHPEQFVSEVQRILKPGGWFCARTPNKWGLIGLAGRLVPNSMHVRVLKHLQPQRQEQDVFPTFHQMNSIGQIKRQFSKQDWNNYSFNHGYEVGYFSRHLLLAWLGYIYNKLVPNRLGLVMMVFLQKKPSA